MGLATGEAGQSCDVIPDASAAATLLAIAANIDAFYFVAISVTYYLLANSFSGGHSRGFRAEVPFTNFFHGTR